METWGSWLPADRRAALLADEPVPDRAEGAVLVADISGFTPLTEELVLAHGPQRGAEELTVALDRVYDALIGAVDAYAGSVIGFSGDAITCWFAGDDGLRAVAAGLLMHEVTRRLTTVRVAVATGAVRRLVVGDPDVQRLDVIAGAAVDAAAEQLAERGAVTLDARTADLLADRLTIAARRAGVAVVSGIVAAARPVASPPATDLVAVSEEQVRPWLLPFVHDRLVAGQGAYLAELRPAVAVFVRFEGIDFATEGAGAALDRYVCWAQRVLDRYVGTLIDVTIGDKGCYLAAVVGAPRAHDDVDAWAVNAALELQLPPADVGPARTIGIGISRGRMRTGAFGGRTRRAYGVQGADMNLAARLMTIAPAGAVVISSQVADLLGDRFDLTALGGVAVKGFADAVSTFEVTGARPGAGSRSPHHADSALVGREAETQEIDASLDRVVGGRNGILVIDGEAGIGKSRLGDDLLARARQRGLRTFTGAADSIEQTTPYRAWRPIVADVLSLADAPVDQAEARSWLLDNLSELRALAPLLTPVLPFPVEDTADTELLTGQSRAETTREVLATILRDAARRQPTVVLVDDGQWLDSASWSLLARLITAPEPLLVVIAMRPMDAPPPDLDAILAAPQTHRVTVPPLAAEEVETLVGTRLAVTSVPPQMMAVVRERAEGNPFFSVEIAYALRDRGLVVIRDGRCDLAPEAPDLHRSALPHTAEGLITSRIDRLTPSQQTALKVAAVIGRAFSLEQLLAIHPFPDQRRRLDDDLTALSRLDLIEVDDAPGGPGYRFRHAIIHAVAADLMLFAQRRRLHRALGELLEESPGPADAHLSLLAHHWAAAADDDAVTPEVLGKAIGYLGGAAQQAFLAYANPEAATHLRTQLGLLARQPASMARDQQELSAHVMLAFSLVQSRGYGDPDVETSYRRAQELADRVEDFGPLAFILYGLFSFYASRAEYAPADATADRLLALSDRLADPATRSVALQARAIVRLLRGDLAAAHGAAKESYDLADQLGDRAFFGFGVDFRLYTSAWLAIAEVLLGRTDQAIAIHDISRSSAEHQPYARAFVIGFAGIWQLLDDPQETLRSAAELAQLASRYSFVLVSVIANLHRGWALAATTGDPDALGLIDASLPMLRFVKLDSFLPWYLGLSADARRRLGRLDEALVAVDEGLAVAHAAGGSFYEAELHRLRGEIRAAQGAATEEVAATYQLAIDVARRQGARWWERRAGASLSLLDQTCALPT